MTPTPVAVIPDDFIREILSFLPVNSLLRFRCVSKSFKTLISDPSFVKLHLKNSQARRNPLFILITYHGGLASHYSLVPYSLNRLIENPPFTLSVDPYYHLSDKGCYSIVGTCNGLILLAGGSQGIMYFRVWNPATRTISPNFGHPDLCYIFYFCCDDSTDTYKIVASDFSFGGFKLKILSIGHNGWRDIQSGPVALHRLQHDLNVAVYLCSTLNWLAVNGDYYHRFENVTVDQLVISSLDLGTETFNQYFLPTAFDQMPPAFPIVALRHLQNGVYICSTLNWMAIKGDTGSNLTVEQFVISSLDLGTETFNQYRLPIGFDEVPPVFPVVSVLGGFLCFSYFYKKTDFVIWQMKEFGVEDSWTQFLKISLQNLQIDYDGSSVPYQLVPLLLSEDADTLVLESRKESHAILYNWRDNRVERSKITPKGTDTNNLTRNFICWHSAEVYVESLVSTF